MNISKDADNNAIFSSKQAKEKIKSNDRTFRAFIENSADGIAILSAEGKSIFISPSIKNILGYTHHEGMQLDLLASAHQEDLLPLTRMLKQALTKPGIPIKGDATRLPHKDGTWRWIEGVITNKINDPAISGIIYNFRDVTERKLAEERLIHSHRLYVLISRINQSIARAGSEKMLFKEVCQVAGNTGRFEIAWISFVDVQSNKLHLTAYHNLTSQDPDFLHSLFCHENGPAAEALKSNSCYVINNLKTESDYNKSKQFAALRELGSAIALPLKKNGKTAYTLNLFTSEIDFFSNTEVLLLKEAANDISFALDIFEKDKLKLESDNQLKQSELHLNQAQAIAHLGSWELDFSSGIATWSAEQLRIFGLSPEDCKQTYDSWLSFIHPLDRDYVSHVIKEVKTSLTNAVYSYRIIKKDSTIRRIESQAHITFNTKGEAVGLYGISHDVTEMKEAEQALQESESNLQAIFENTSEGFILTDIKGTIKFFNNNSKETIRLNTDQKITIGDSIYDFIPPSRKDKYKDTIAKVLSGETLQYDYPYTRKNGETKWFNFTVNPVYGAGVVAGLSISSGDITERKQSEQLLQESEIFSKGILAALTSNIAVIDKTGNIIAVNKAWNDFAEENIAGSRECVSTKSNYFDVCKKSIAAGEIVAEQTLKGIYSVLNKEAQTFELEYPCHSASRERWFNIRVSNFGGNDPKAVIAHEDITERKKIENELAESRAEMETVFHASLDAIVIIDDKGRILKWDTKTEILFGWKQEEVIGTLLAESIIPPKMREAHNKGMEHFLKTGEGPILGKTIEVKALRKDNTEIDISLSISPSYIKNKYQFIGFIRDITERKEAEAALKKSERTFTELAEFNQTLIEASPMGIASYDAASGECLTINTAFSQIVGGTRKELSKQNFRYIKSWQETDLLKDAEETLLTGKVHQNEINIRTTFGQQVWLNYRFIRFLNKERPHLLLLINDISKRKSAEELLKKSESNLNAVIENTDALIYSLDRDFKYITYNNALYTLMRDLYGINIKPGLNVFEFIKKLQPDQVQEWNSVYSRAFKGEIVKFEKESVVNNFYSYTRFSIHPIWENENVVGLSCFVNDITKEKQAEEENRFKANLLNTIGQAAVATDLKGTVSYWNKAAEVIYGWTKKEAMGKNINNLIYWNKAKGQAFQIMKELMHKRSWSGEFTVQQKDGIVFPVCATNSPIYNYNQKLTGIISISSDISEKKNLETILDKTNKMARIGSFEVDLVKNTLYWSPITRQIHEVEDDFVPDLESAINFYKAGPGREAITQAIHAAIDDGTSFDLELEIVTAKGNERWVRSIGTSEHSSAKCIRLNGSCQDIDAGKKAEIEVLKVYEEKNIILESIGDAFFAVDKNWLVTYWNKQAEKGLCVPKDKIVGRNFWETFSDSINSQSYKKYHQAIDTKQAINFIDYYASSDKWFDISAYPSATGLSVFFKDITQQIKSEEEHLKMTADLIQRNKDLEQFSYIVSHNLRAPVANIIGVAEELGHDTNDAEVKEMFLKELCSNVERLDNFILDLNNILQVKREISEKKETVNLTQMIDSIQSDIQNLIRKEQVQIKTDFVEVNEFTTLKSYLHSIFYNLISNSIKFRQPDCLPLIEIKTEKFDEKLIITFKDNGTGIDLAKKGDQVFGLYKRFHKNIEGKGMGLFMVKTQVETLGGKITIQSEVNKGTEFKIVFEL